MRVDKMFAAKADGWLMDGIVFTAEVCNFRASTGMAVPQVAGQLWVIGEIRELGVYTGVNNFN